MVVSTPREPAPVAFAVQLERFGSRTALITDDGTTISYAELAMRADAVAATMEGPQGVLLMVVNNDAATIITYLAALRSGRPILPVSAGQPEMVDRLVAIFHPAWLSLPADPIGGDRRLLRAVKQPAPVHPDLALLLSTSGTTGAAKLVRLSRANLDANASSIARYLDLDEGERAPTALPLHYSYGLSVLHSHLSVGASIWVTDRSVTDPAFWAEFVRHGCTSFAGVPHSYDLLVHSGFLDRDVPGLRTMTQAGGRLSTQLVTRFDHYMRKRQGRFFVMYGQTEATARMAYLPPELLGDHADCIGRAIPDGELRLIDDDGHSINGEGVAGELVYRGPNVMLGYAECSDDLALGRSIEELHTGDLAERTPSGLFRIIGRKARFAKLFGLRIGLDEVEAWLEADGVSAMTASDDERLFIAVQETSDADHVGDRLSRWLGLPRTAIKVIQVDSFPLLPSGKRDYRKLPAMFAVPVADTTPAPVAGRAPLRFEMARILNRSDANDGDSFAGLGGDSLSYVNAVMAIEERLGFLPDDWPNLRFADLEALAVTASPGGHRVGFAPFDTEMLVRALAICSVVFNHATDWPLGGGTLALVLLIGFNLARFQMPALISGEVVPMLRRMALAVLLPYFLLVGGYAMLNGSIRPSYLTLTANFDGGFGRLMEPYWFISLYAQFMVALAVIVVLAAPVRRALACKPFAAGMAALTAAAAVMVLTADASWSIPLRTPDQMVPLILLGWCLCLAKGPEQRVLVVIALGALCAFEFSARIAAGWSLSHALLHIGWISLPVVLLMQVPHLRLPAWLRRILYGLSGAAFTIYLTHNFIIWLLVQGLGLEWQAAVAIIAIALSYGGHMLAVRLSAKIQSLAGGPARLFRDDGGAIGGNAR